MAMIVKVLNILPRFVYSCLFMSSMAMAAAAPDYARDVRPILASHCFKCHGQDEGARKAKLRLDVRDLATTTFSIIALLIPMALMG